MQFHALAQRHPGQPIAVLGGGVSLPRHVKALPDNCIRISVNEHGAKLTQCHYIVALDNIEAKLRPYGVPIIGPKPWADYQFTAHPGYGNSGMEAVWAAAQMGAHPIIVCGMDLYQGGTYWHDKAAESSGTQTPTSKQVELWRRVRVSAEVRVMGGPLTELWPKYRKAEVFPEFIPPAEPEKASTGVLVRITRNTRVRDRVVTAGEVLEIDWRDAQALYQVSKAQPA